jgi:dTDP-4-amino-4,6-dideoxygalactose transaminase
MYLQPIFGKYPYYGVTIAEALFENGLCLPSGFNTSEEYRIRIKEIILGFFK